MGIFGGFTVKLKRGATGGEVGYFEIAPADAASPTGSQGFHSSFLGGEPCGIAFIEIGFALGVCDFAIGEDTFLETAAVAGEGVFDPRNFAQIDSGSDDHDPPPGEVMVSRPCITPLVDISASAIF